ncbi:predicted protein [Botrytis cinerea T4]|uniref:Uncharacterized protein n=1 Tax=Botryotinia fuckeliana (strain T4) TaxID=999810 RepID=G2XUA9_BOTF4|nr:predicted protein [Botrytis cinerea T4]
MHHRSEGYILRDLLPAERCATWDPNGPFDQSCLCICDPMAPFKTLARTPTRMMIEWLRRLGITIKIPRVHVFGSIRVETEVSGSFIEIMSEE